MPILADDGQSGGWIWRCKPERPVGAVAVVVLDVDPEALLRCAEPGQAEAVTSVLDQTARASSSNATAIRRPACSLTASS